MHITDSVGDPGILLVTIVDCDGTPGAVSQDIDCYVDVPVGESAVVTVTYEALPALGVVEDDNTRDQWSTFRFVFANGEVLEGTTRNTGSKNDYYFAEGGFTLHLSCSDQFPGGWGDTAGPSASANPAWQVVSYSIIRYKKGEFFRDCGAQVTPLTVENTATATWTDPVGDNDLDEGDTALLSIGGDGPPPEPEPKAAKLTLTKVASVEDGEPGTNINVFTGDTVVWTIEATFDPGDSGATYVSDVVMTDDLPDITCSTVEGDSNNDSLLQPGETWSWSCEYEVNAGSPPPSATPPGIKPRERGTPDSWAEYMFVFVNDAGDYKVVEGSNRLPSDTGYTGKRNDARIAFPDFGGADFTVHVSCSDSFPDGYGSAAGPTPQDGWRVVSYGITKYNKGRYNGQCLGNPIEVGGPTTITNTATIEATLTYDDNTSAQLTAWAQATLTIV